MTRINRLTTEYRANPFGIDVLQPRLAWRIETDRQGARQIAYRVIAASQREHLAAATPDLWDTGKVDSDQSVQVSYAGQTLRSRQRVYWQVTVWDETGDAITSEVAWFEMALLDSKEWQAQWIGTAFAGGPRSMLPVPYVRKTFMLAADVVSARLYISALGLFECSINGQTVGEDVFAPGWTDYHQRVQYLTYDVTTFLHRGDNAIGALLGDGWAAGYVGWLHRQNYVDRPQLLAQLEITLADGSTPIVVSDGSWAFQFGAITHSDLLMGEAYDARKELAGWDTPSFVGTGALPVAIFNHPDLQIVALNGPTVRRISELAPVKPPFNRGGMGRKRHVFDFGQNMVGRVRFKGAAPAGTTITIRFAEVLNEDGSLT